MVSTTHLQSKADVLTSTSTSERADTSSRSDSASQRGGGGEIKSGFTCSLQASEDTANRTPAIQTFRSVHRMTRSRNHELTNVKGAINSEGVTKDIVSSTASTSEKIFLPLSATVAPAYDFSRESTTNERENVSTSASRRNMITRHLNGTRTVCYRHGLRDMLCPEPSPSNR